MLLLSWILSIIVGFWVGWYWRDIRWQIRRLELQIAAHITRHKRAEAPEPLGKVVEPIDDPIAAAKAEFEAEQRRINGK